MAQRPSEPLLTFLRDAIRRKGLNTADLAHRAGMERAALKHRLSGAEPLTVDELIALSNALALTPAEMGLAGVEAAVSAPGTDRAATPTADSAATPTADPAAAPPEGPDPFGNLPRQVIELGVSLGIDLFLALDVRQLGGSGIPRAVLNDNPDQLRLRMEARWYPQNKFRFLDEDLVCMLSFDALYECTLPWSAFRTVTFLLPAEPPKPRVEPPAPAAPRAPFLRVVK